MTKHRRNMNNFKWILKIPVIWRFSLIIMVLTTLYWSFMATDRYVSSAHVVLQTSDIAQPEMNFSSMMTGSVGANKSDLLILRDYLLSVDILKQLDSRFDLRAHYSNHDIDLFSRLFSVDSPIEHFHEYYLKRVEVYLDDYSGVLVVNVSAFDQAMASKLATALLQLGEEKMNQMGQRLANEQVAFIEKQVDQLSNRLTSARNTLLEYQDREGMISPTGTVESMTLMVSELKSQLIQLRAKESVLSQFQSKQAPEMVKLTSEIAALKDQIKIENKKLTASQGNGLNKASAEFETLKLKLQFAQELYSNALATLEATRVEAARKLKQVSIIQEPTKPEYAVEPNRLYQITIYILMIGFFTLILNLILMIVKEHKD